ncbi:MAG: alpha-amylase [Bdellovibrionales bacterium]|nr:alpha-amylase [Bdellovibrionales bacterium]
MSAGRPVLNFIAFVAASTAVASPPAGRENGVMMQTFHWYTPSVKNGARIDPARGLWNEIARTAPTLAKKGITALWIPPAYKGLGGTRDVGYGVYDRYDLGEFDQKGAVPTKYGSRKELEAAIRAAHRANLDVYGDVVLNHMLGQDGGEDAPVVRVYGNNRNAEIPGSETRIFAPTLFTFPGRAGKYSTFTWHWTDFTGVDYDLRSRESAVYKFRGPYGGFQEEVDHEFGNYDYLLGADLNFRNPEVRAELDRWGAWFMRTLSLDGFRLDAVKHMPFTEVADWLDTLRSKVRSTLNTPLFAVGEYWSGDLARLSHYIHVTRGKLSLFDVPLHQRFHQAGDSGGRFDLRTIFDGTLAGTDPTHAVTFVENHDTQPLQSLESPVADWFKPLAYALILLRAEGYPCLFYADYYGATYTDRGRTVKLPKFASTLDPMLAARRRFAWGRQHDYFDHPDVIGWTREGDPKHPGGLAVLLNDHPSYPGAKRMCLGGETGGRSREFIDVLHTDSPRVSLDARNCGTFKTGPASVSVWVDARAIGW